MDDRKGTSTSVSMMTHSYNYGVCVCVCVLANMHTHLHGHIQRHTQSICKQEYTYRDTNNHWHSISSTNLSLKHNNGRRWGGHTPSQKYTGYKGGCEMEKLIPIAVEVGTLQPVVTLRLLHGGDHWGY